VTRAILVDPGLQEFVAERGAVLTIAIQAFMEG
jgi:hypothetical protein